jgi:hypothetical protein
MGDVLFWVVAIALGFGVAYALWPAIGEEDEAMGPGPHDAGTYLRHGWPEDPKVESGDSEPGHATAPEVEGRKRVGEP